MNVHGTRKFFIVKRSEKREAKSEKRKLRGGAYRIRTGDLYNANVAL